MEDEMRDKEVDQEQDQKIGQEESKIPIEDPLKCVSIVILIKEKPSNQLRLLGFFHADMYSRNYSP